MSAILRIRNLSVGNTPFGRINTALDGVKLLYTTDESGISYISPNNTEHRIVGNPVITPQYIKGSGTTSYIDTGYRRDASKSFSIAVVAKRDGADGLQFYAGDYHNSSHPENPRDVGMGILAAGDANMRTSIIGTGKFGGPNTPSDIINGLQVGTWYFACLTMDVDKKEGHFYVPAVGVDWTETWDVTFSDSLNDYETISIAGNSAGASGSDAFVSYMAFYERAITSQEVEQQYNIAKEHCLKKGITVL